MSQSEQPVFQLASGVRLRPWESQYAQVLVDSSRDPGIQHWNRPGLLSIDDAQARIARWRRRWEAEEAAVWAIQRVDDDHPVGLIGLGDMDFKGGSAEFLYWLLPAARGSGAMVDATIRVSRWALDVLGLHRLRITHSVANTASCRVATRAGFALEGTMRSALLHADGWHDEHLHARIQGDAWPDEEHTTTADLNVSNLRNRPAAT
ncbi:GNAT family N-acetyltransferase [Streptomyces hygroscopicus]|uniref:GNAT family N-acetyltransferase n=1 Tax=Streptomyces hygroscopicus TaxID=1912 RepID=UPI00224050D8|nr:GNAT family N-acetyltransferase [Streptomyces hygroscopicus]